MSGEERERVAFGATELPAEQREALHRAKVLQVLGIAYLVSCVLVVFTVMGSSQAMKVAWVEDLLSLVPPIVFLVSLRRVSRPPSPEHPYGHHRAIASAHLASAVALLAMGAFMVVDSGMGLVKAEHPPIGTHHLFGQTVWAGWLMIAAMVYTGIGPVILGHLKKPLAEKLHDKVLWADAEMNAADWRTAGAAIIGILGIGVGWWWADAVLTAANGPAWVGSAAVRVRDQGHLLHAEVFVVPSAPVELADLEALVDTIQGLDWKLNDVVVVPVSRLPDAVRATPAAG